MVLSGKKIKAFQKSLTSVNISCGEKSDRKTRSPVDKKRLGTLLGQFFLTTFAEKKGGIKLPTPTLKDYLKIN